MTDTQSKSPHSSNPYLDEETCRLICPISAAMVGVCLTTIGLVRIVTSVDRAGTLADDLLSIDAIMFLTATLTSYAALRTRTIRRMHRLELVADVSFILSMILLATICLFITYEVGAR